MKTIFQDDKIIVFLNNYKINDSLEESFKTLLSHLEHKYDLEFNGYYDIDVYEDTHYGMIVEINNLEADYYCFSGIEIKINLIKNTDFLYKIEYGSIQSSILKKCNCYQIKNDLYLKIKEDLTDYEFANLLELSELVYGKGANNILKYSKKVKI